MNDKTQLVFDISANETRYVLRQGVTQSVDSNGQFHNKDMSGFCYYNWDMSRWDEIGLTDPANGGGTGFYFDYPGTATNQLVGNA